MFNDYRTSLWLLQITHQTHVSYVHENVGLKNETKQ